MRSTLIVVALLLAGATAYLFPVSLEMNEQTMAGRGATGNAPISLVPCTDVTFQYCQFGLNNDLGLDPALTWRNATQFTNFIDALLQKDMPTTVRVCQAFQRFKSCLGPMYRSCVNRLTLMAKPNADLVQAFTYVDDQLQMDFTCNGGFEILASQYSCVMGVQTLASTANCVSAFNQTVQSGGFTCNAVDTFDKCMETATTASCGNEVGWFYCELQRQSFQFECPLLQCHVKY